MTSTFKENNKVPTWCEEITQEEIYEFLQPIRRAVFVFIKLLNKEEKRSLRIYLENMFNISITEVMDFSIIEIGRNSQGNIFVYGRDENYVLNSSNWNSAFKFKYLLPYKIAKAEEL